MKTLKYLFMMFIVFTITTSCTDITEDLVTNTNTEHKTDPPTTFEINARGSDTGGDNSNDGNGGKGSL